ncbi:MAG: S-methyl-5-thioribose kinase, partial [Erysipelotrichaceae bacterium]|nr:S-methyl-5-thioribose kinase [Erysipelotrichaceae bacterium]
MSRFDHHFRMREADCIDFVKEKVPGFFSNNDLKCTEIGDGNINYVFRVSDGRKSLIVKHADAYFRDSSKPKSVDRSHLESEMLMIEKELCPKHIPDIYYYDRTMCAIVMQDIGDHENMRYALIRHEIFPEFAHSISSFLINTLIRTGIYGLPIEKKREYESRYTNHDMCEISDRLVFSEPYTNKLGSNVVTEGNEEFVREKLYEDSELRYEVGILKNAFQSKRQCLIHGDLHSGSIFIRKDSMMVLDPEFGIMGPAGYDVGNVLAHLIFAYHNSRFTDKNSAFEEWIKECIVQICDDFINGSKELIEEINTDKMYSGKRFIEEYIGDIMSDSFGYAGTELIRRIMGSAKVRDLEVPDRINAEREIIDLAIKMIKNRRTMSGDQVVRLM